MGDDLRHVRTEHRVDQEDRRHDHQGRAERPPRRLQQRQQPDDRDDEVEVDRLADPVGEVAVEQEEVGCAEAGRGRQEPLLHADAIGARRQRAGDGRRDRDDGDDPGREGVACRDRQETADQKRRHDAQHALEGRILRREGQIGQHHGEGEVDRARFGVVEHAEAEGERQRRGEPELEQRPDERDAGDQLGENRACLPAARIGRSDHLIDFGLAEAALGRLLVLRHQAPPAGASPKSRSALPLTASIRTTFHVRRSGRRPAVSPAGVPSPGRSYIQPFSLKYFAAPSCSGADRPSLTMSSGFRLANAGCRRLKRSKLSKTAFTTW